MPTWFLFTISSVAILAVAEIAQKVAVTSKDDISAEANNTVGWFVQGTLSLLYYLFFAYAPLPTFSPLLILQLVILGSIYFWAGTLFYTSYKTGSASVNSILLSSSIVISTILGILFFGESSSIIKIIGSLIIIAAIIYLNYDKKTKLSKGNIYALSGAVLYGVAFTLDKSFAIQLNPHIYHIFFAYSIWLTGFVYRGKVIIKDLRKIGLDTLKAASLAAVAFFIWNRLNFISYTVGGEVGRIDAINNATVFFIILLEFLILKDKSNLKKKIFSAIIASVGVAILAISK